MEAIENCHKIYQAQFFLAHLLVPLTSWPCLHFLPLSLVGLTIHLAIEGAMSMGEEVAIGLSECYLYNKLISF